MRYARWLSLVAVLSAAGIPVALLVFGIAALVFGGFGCNRQSTVLDVGSIKATATEHKIIPVAPIAGVVAVIGGLAVLVVPHFRRA